MQKSVEQRRLPFFQAMAPPLMLITLLPAGMMGAKLLGRWKWHWPGQGRAGVEPKQIGYVNAHATSTPVGDAAELAALTHVFGTGGGGVPVSSTKSATGHMLGAAGAIKAVFSVLALRDQLLPAGLNIDDPMEPAADFDLVRGKARASELNHVLSNAFGFGGVNAALVFSRFDL